MEFIKITLADKKGDIYINPLQIVSLNISEYSDSHTVIITSNPDVTYYAKETVGDLRDMIIDSK